jgi:hypothetical protein
LLLTYERGQVELDSQYPNRVTAINPVSSMREVALSDVFQGNRVRTIHVRERLQAPNEAVSPTTRLLNSTCLGRVDSTASCLGGPAFESQF